MPNRFKTKTKELSNLDEEFLEPQTESPHAEKYNIEGFIEYLEEIEDISVLGICELPKNKLAAIFGFYKYIGDFKVAKSRYFKKRDIVRVGLDVKIE